MRLLQITECSKFVGNCTLNYTINIYHCIAFADNTVQWCCIYFCCTFFFITVGFKTILQSLPKFRFHTNQQFSIVGKSVSICLKGFFFSFILRVENFRHLERRYNDFLIFVGTFFNFLQTENVQEIRRGLKMERATPSKTQKTCF